jgi:hypothetical protein
MVSLSDMSLEMVNDTIPRLKITFNRTGNMSVYGDMTVDYISPQGTTTQVGLVRGIAVYTPNSIWRFQLKLDNNKGIDYHTGKLHVVYSSETGEKLSESEILLH